MSESFTDLLKFNVLDSDIEKVKYYTIYSTRPDLVLKSGELKKQVSIFSIPEDHNKHSWSHEDFDYQFSEHGFRDSELPKHIDIGAFGCSYTFGVGLPLNNLWHKLLTKNTDLLSYNFGQPGASIGAITDIFNIVSNNVKIDKAVFLLPNYMRDLIAFEEVVKWKKSFKLKSIMPQLPAQGYLYNDIITEQHYKYTPEWEFIRKMKDSIYLIEKIARMRDIKVYISSWDRRTYEMLEIMDLRYARLISEWRIPNDKTLLDDVARDAMHPGFLLHNYWIEQVRDQVLI